MTGKTGKLYLNGYFEAPADQLAAVEAGLQTHIDLTRAEAGCVSFDITPSPDIPGRFIVAEVFESEAAFEVHKARTAASDWAAISADCKREFSIRVE